MITNSRHDLPSNSRFTTQEMSYTLLVNGAAIEASVSASEMPASAVLRAAQSLAPSPHIMTNSLFLAALFFS